MIKDHNKKESRFNSDLIVLIIAAAFMLGLWIGVLAGERNSINVEKARQEINK